VKSSYFEIMNALALHEKVNFKIKNIINYKFKVFKVLLDGFYLSL
jgi:hypothetical protein